LLRDPLDYFTAHEAPHIRTDHCCASLSSVGLASPCSPYCRAVPTAAHASHPRRPDAFDGPMADLSNAKHVPCPMSGAVDTIFVKAGDSVRRGARAGARHHRPIQTLGTPNLFWCFGTPNL
jgi:hypothetical protein